MKTIGKTFTMNNVRSLVCSDGSASPNFLEGFSIDSALIIYGLSARIECLIGRVDWSSDMNKKNNRTLYIDKELS